MPKYTVRCERHQNLKPGEEVVICSGPNSCDKLNGYVTEWTSSNSTVTRKVGA